ncbi:MAG TPA: DUF305 domain-containing protein [Gemmatimonadaceae bacterium]|nr:DUF305 domain-containing protein [Gemmatimonadaceae bacterium]
MRHYPRGTAALLLVLASTAACSAKKSLETAPRPAPTMHGDPAAIANAKPDSNRFPYTQADVDFMSGMIGHHSQAIAMAKWAPTRAASQSIRTLTARIINAQQDEITLMSQWLRQHGQKVPEATSMGIKMNMGGMEHVMAMPGMLTEAQMKELEASTGKKFDELFLTFMIQHHKGALSMVKDLFGTPGAGQDETTFKLANDINADQETEIDRMQKMLIQLKFEGSLP